MQEIKADSQQTSQTQEPSTFSFSRRSFIRAIIAAAALPENLTEALNTTLSDSKADKLPWITNPEVRAALEELDQFYAVTIQHADLLSPNSLGEYLMGSKMPASQTLSENCSLFSSRFWSLLKERNRSNIEDAVNIANSVANKECTIEPRRRQLINRVLELTGEQPAMLRIEPKLRDLIKSALKECNKEFVPLEEYWRYSQDAFAALRDYKKHYMQGTLNDFYKKYSNRIEWKPRNSELLRGRDYTHSEDVLKKLQKQFEELLDLKHIRIESSRGQCQAYFFIIKGEKITTEYLNILVRDICANPNQPNGYFQISKPFQDIKGHPTAYNIEPLSATNIRPLHAAFFLYDPPAELAELLESKKAAKESRHS